MTILVQQFKEGSQVATDRIQQRCAVGCHACCVCCFVFVTCLMSLYRSSEALLTRMAAAAVQGMSLAASFQTCCVLMCLVDLLYIAV